MDQHLSPGIGHNSGLPPESIAEILTPEDIREGLSADTESLRERADKLLAGVDRWRAKYYDRIDNADAASATTDFIRQIKEHAKRVEGRRTEIKAPYLTATKLVDSFFKAVTDPLLGAARRMETALTEFSRAQEAERRRQAQAAAEQARREADAAAEAARRAASVDVIDNALEAEKAAAKAQRDAAQAPAEFSRVRGDLGGVSSLRKGPWQIEVLDVRKVDPRYLRVDESLVRADAQAMVRQGVSDEDIERSMPGLRVFRESVARVS